MANRPPIPAAMYSGYNGHGDGQPQYTDPTPEIKPKKDKELVVSSPWVDDARRVLKGSLVVVALVIDMALHLGIGAAVWFAVTTYSDRPQTAVPLAVFAWLASSFIHRTFVQRVLHTTVGKALFAFRLHHPDGSRATLWELIKQWFSGGFGAVSLSLQVLQIFG
ncbi:RDD family protein [Nocardia sp. NPDC023852]|uniref:RDD family protein n=1 Tax=Nocardia sp. NPDC023852 TaxID=3154697 RepID=UPI0033E9A239